MDHNAHVTAWKQRQAKLDLQRRGLHLPTSKRPWVRGADIAETFKRIRARTDKKLRVA